MSATAEEPEYLVAQRREADGFLSIAPEPAEYLLLARRAGTPDLSRSVLPEPVDWAALFSRTIDYVWLVEDFWPKGRQLHIFAARKTGKSLIMLWISACLAAGRDPFTGEPREPIIVDYFDYEMSEEDLLERLEDMGFTPATLGNLRYYLHPPLAPLDTYEGGAALMELVERDQAQAVVLDTVSRVVAGEENSSDTFRALWRNTGARLKAAGISMARLDHEGHEAGRSRGSSAKSDDVDLVWRLAAADGGYSLTRKAARIAWVPELIDLTIGSEPLSFARTDGNWPAGTKALAERLDALNAPLDLSRRKAAELLKTDGGSAGRPAVLLKALTFRRIGNHSGTTQKAPERSHDGNHPPEPANQAGNHRGNHPKPLPAPTGSLSPSLREGTGEPLEGETPR